MAGLNQMLTAKEVAEILGVHPKTVHIWLREGKLHGVKISYRAWRIPQISLDHFIEMNSNALTRMDKNLTTGNPDKNELKSLEPSGSSSMNHSVPQLTMKHYLQNIMREDPQKNEKEHH